MAIGGTRVVQVTNIAPQATKDQMQTLFGYLGKIEDIRLYPTIRDVSCPVQSRICYIKFADSNTVGIAQHMTNTVFIDRALIVIPIQNGDIPDEYYALEMTKNGTIVPGLCPSEPNLPSHVVNMINNVNSEQVITTTDPHLEANGLSSYPHLPANYDSRKIEEIRRTLVVVNVDLAISADDIIETFSAAGEVKYVRFCSRSSDNSTHVLLEFSEQPSIIQALKMNGKDLKGKPLKIVHANQAIVKPQAKSNEAAQREIEEAMSRVKEAQNLISATIDPVIGMLSKDKRGSRRSRSRSRGRHRRSRSRSHSRRSRSRHRSHRSSSRPRRSRSRERKQRSKSRSGRRSGSRSRRSASRSSHSRRSPSHTPRSLSRRSRSKSHTRLSRKEKRKSKERARSKDKNGSTKDREKSRDRDRVRSKEREKSRDRERSKGRSYDKDYELREKKIDKENSTDVDDKRSSGDKKRLSRSSSRPRYRSRSRDVKRSRSREKKRSRSRGCRRRTPSPHGSRRRSLSRSKDRERKREKKEKKDKRDRSPSRSKVPRNYDEEERGFDTGKHKRKSYDRMDSLHDYDHEKESDNMDISNSP